MDTHTGMREKSIQDDEALVEMLDSEDGKRFLAHLLSNELTWPGCWIRMHSLYHHDDGKSCFHYSIYWSRWC